MKKLGNLRTWRHAVLRRAGFAEKNDDGHDDGAAVVRQTDTPPLAVFYRGVYPAVIECPRRVPGPGSDDEAGCQHLGVCLVGDGGRVGHFHDNRHARARG